MFKTFGMNVCGTAPLGVDTHITFLLYCMMIRKDSEENEERDRGGNTLIRDKSNLPSSS
jgi:hypothetical protein